MKKFFSLIALAASLVGSQADTWFSTSINNGTLDTNVLVVASSVKLTSAIFAGGNAGAFVQLYDNSTATNKVSTSADYVTVSQVNTTNVNAYVPLGFITNSATGAGITNYTTNIVIVTTFTTNSSPVTLPVLATYYVPASTQVSIDNPGLMFGKGIVAKLSTTNTLSTPISFIGSYKPNP